MINTYKNPTESNLKLPDFWVWVISALNKKNKIFAFISSKWGIIQLRTSVFIQKKTFYTYYYQTLLYIFLLTTFR